MPFSAATGARDAACNGPAATHARAAATTARPAEAQENCFMACKSAVPRWGSERGCSGDGTGGINRRRGGDDAIFSIFGRAVAVKPRKAPAAAHNARPILRHFTGNP